MTTARWAGAGLVVSTVGWFGLYAYNSGYGYDALEILVIVQSLDSSKRFYDLVPAKPCGLYYLLYALTAAGMPLTRITVTAVITVLLAAAVGAATVFTRRFVGPVAATGAALLVFAAGAFMELNFLVTEGLVVAAGFGAAYLLGRFFDGGPGWMPVAAGVVLGLGFLVKQTAAFYSVGSTMWLIGWCRPWHRAAAGVGAFAAGHLIPVAAVAGYFAATGRWGPYLEWTYLVPLQMPASAEYLDRLYTKLAWFWLVIGAAAVGVLVRRDWRRDVLGNPHVCHALVAGVAALYPVVKSQAPHYVFPAAAFLSVFVAAVFARSVGGMSGRAVAVVGLAVVALTGSVVAYRPAALDRLVQVRSFADENATGEKVRRLVPPGSKALVLTEDALKVYFLSGCEPAVPVPHFDFQAVYYLDRHPYMVLDALADPATGYVRFDPAFPPPIRFDPLSPTDRKVLWDAVALELQTRFVRLPGSHGEPHEWGRQPDPP